ncbi:sugar kinase [Streptomyces sp. NPDC052051]|uniref:sugar kinase n=1 Tax=Streptomyces sp. NPDC052051 TaxID=3154649 RepID=UPI00343B2878
MTATTSVPHQPAPPDEPGRPPESHGHMVRRRALTLLTIMLLIGVPAGYLVISANQSRDSGKVKEARYSATGLTAGRPSSVLCSLYQVKIPAKATEVAYYETNNWKTSRLYAQFNTSEAGLAKFLHKIDKSTGELKENDTAISPRDQGIVGWSFTGEGPWYGLTHTQKNPAPTLDVMVNRADPDHPTVYVVSRTTP